MIFHLKKCLTKLPTDGTQIPDGRYFHPFTQPKPTADLETPPSKISRMLKEVRGIPKIIYSQGGKRGQEILKGGTL